MPNSRHTSVIATGRPPIDAAQRYARDAGTPLSWIDAVVDPTCNAMIEAFAGPRPSLPPSVREARRTLVESALCEGPGALTDQEKPVVLVRTAVGVAPVCPAQKYELRS